MSEFWETLFVPISNHTAAQTFSSCIVTFPRQRCARYCNSVHQWCSPLSSPLSRCRASPHLTSLKNILHIRVLESPRSQKLSNRHCCPPLSDTIMRKLLQLYSSFSSSCLASKTSTTSVRWASRVPKVDRSLALPPSPHWFNFFIGCPFARPSHMWYFNNPKLVLFITVHWHWLPRAEHVFGSLRPLAVTVANGVVASLDELNSWDGEALHPDLLQFIGWNGDMVRG